jgi:hypothetical protein
MDCSDQRADLFKFFAQVRNGRVDFHR